MNLSSSFRSAKTQKILLFVLFAAGWFALFAQFCLIIQNRQVSLPETVIRYFSFFTILTNLLVAICCTNLLAKKNSNDHHFFSKPSTLTAITVYILIVGIIYNLILRSLWNPEGLQKVVDELLHTVIPVLFFIYWMLFVAKKNLKWQNAFVWLVYPFLYMTYTLIHGAFTKYYPYPFVDVNKIGLNQALINGVIILIAFYLLSLLLIAMGKIKKH